MKYPYKKLEVWILSNDQASLDEAVDRIEGLEDAMVTEIETGVIEAENISAAHERLIFESSDEVTILGLPIEKE